MDSVISAIPPFNRMFLISIWMETLIYGMNCIIFTGALYVLIHRQRKPNFLIAVSCILFLLATTHVGFSLHQLIGGLIDTETELASLYFVTPTHPEYVAKLVLYTTTVFAQDLVLIWRLWVLSSRNWKVVALPLVIEGAHVGKRNDAAGYICCARAALGKTSTDQVTHDATLITWILDLAMNVGVTSLIVYKLYIAGRRVSSSGLSKENKYLSSIFTVVESGSIFASAIIVMVGMFLANIEAVVAAADVAVQIAVLTPLLIIVRVGFGLTHGSSSNETTTSSKTASANGRSILDKTGVHISTAVEYELSRFPTAKDQSLA